MTKKTINQYGASRNASAAGRPRSVETEEAILAASLRITQRSGYGRLTIEGIAAEAGVGKQTIYRWWPSKAAVVLEAFRREGRTNVQVAPTGNLEEDVTTFLTAVFERLNGPSGIVLRSLLAESLIDDEFAAQLRDQYLNDRVAEFKSLIPKQSVRPAVRSQVIEMTYGAIWYRLVARQPLTRASARKLAQEVVRLLGFPCQL